MKVSIQCQLDPITPTRVEVANSAIASLRRQADDAVKAKLDAAGFARQRSTGPYVLPVGRDGLLLIFARVSSRYGTAVLEPLVALENTRLRAELGETKPPQPYPRFAQLFLAYMVDGRADIAWRFQTRDEMQAAVEDIASTVVSSAIPFAKKWCPPASARKLVQMCLRFEGPHGVFPHPWPATAAA